MTSSDAIIPFLQQLGIEAYVFPDAIYGNLITLNTRDYERHRQQLDAWFTRVRQIGQHSHLQLRLRGASSTS